MHIQGILEDSTDNHAGQQLTVHVGQQRRHRCKEQPFELSGKWPWWDDLGE